MFAYCIKRFLREDFWREAAQPEVLAKAVARHRLDAAVFAVGVGVVNCAIDKVVQARQHTQGAGQPLIGLFQRDRSVIGKIREYRNIPKLLRFIVSPQQNQNARRAINLPCQ